MTSITEPTASASRTAPAAPLPDGYVAPELAVTAFEPMVVTAHHPAPTSTIHPDQSKRWWMRLLPLLRPQLPFMALAMAASGVTLFIQVTIPQIVGDAIDHGVSAFIAEQIPLARRPEALRHLGASVALGHYVWILVLLAAASVSAGFVFQYLLRRGVFQLEYVMRVLMFQKLGSMPFSYYDTVQTGQMVSRANSDIRTVQMFLQFAPMIVSMLCMVMLAMYKMLQLNVLMACASLLFLPVVLAMSTRMQRMMFPVSWLISSRMAEVATVVEENVGGAEVVRGFTAESEQISLIDQRARSLRWASIKQSNIRANLTPAVMNVPRVGQVAVLLIGGKLVIDGRLSVGDLAQFLAYMTMVQMPFMMLGMMLMMAQRAGASAARIFEVLDAEPDLVDRPGAQHLVECSGEVVFDDVTFSYNGRAAGVLEGTSFTMRPGETVAVVGRTGSGKSTIARLVPRFYDVDGGTVRIDGHDVRDVTLASLRSHVGLVLDDSFLFSGTIRDNIAFGRPDASEDDIRAVAAAAGAADFIAGLPDGYDTLVGERGSTLSGGQRQRIAIARTLLVNPRVLILDDCTSAIDPHREHEIHGALRTLMSGRTTLVIAHRPATISLAGRVLVLDGGRIVADGTHEELLQTSLLYQEILSHADELDAVADESDSADPLAEPSMGVGLLTDGPQFGGPTGGFGMGPGGDNTFGAS